METTTGKFMGDQEREVGGLRIQIDRLLCVGFGDCIEIAPEAFVFDDEGIIVFLESIDQVERERLIRSCESCPVDALVVIDQTGRKIVG